MARNFEKLNSGEFRETITDYDKCRWLYNGVCVNADCPMIADYPSEKYCDSCRYFQGEVKDNA